MEGRGVERGCDRLRGSEDGVSPAEWTGGDGVTQLGLVIETEISEEGDN